MKGPVTLELKIYNVVNYISLAAAIITCIILVGLGFFKYHLIDRVSLRIQGIIALIDISRHISFINLTHSNEAVCRAIGYFIRLTNHVYLFLSIAIAFNMQLLIIQNIRPRQRLQWIYSSISLFLAASINLIPYANKFGRNSKGHCRFIDDENTKWWNVFLIYLTNIPGVLYCLAIFIMINLKVYRKKQQLKLIRDSEDQSGSDPMGFLWTLYFRISLYPLSCFITLFPFTLSKLFFDITKYKLPALVSLAFFCHRITGTLNLITMFCDPHCQIAIKFLYQSIFNLKPPQESNILIELTTSRVRNLSSSYQDQLEYSNGDRILMREYIRLL